MSREKTLDYQGKDGYEYKIVDMQDKQVWMSKVRL